VLRKPSGTQCRVWSVMRKASGRQCKVHGMLRKASGRRCKVYGMFRRASGRHSKVYGVLRKASGRQCKSGRKPGNPFCKYLGNGCRHSETMKIFAVRRQRTRIPVFFIINPLVYLGALEPWWLFSWQGEKFKKSIRFYKSEQKNLWNVVKCRCQFV